MDGERPLVLKCGVQRYDWGKHGRQSLVARLIGDNDEKVPFAELWIGAHPTNPSWVTNSDLPDTLDRVINRNPEFLLGHKVSSQFGKLPFLLKVISVGSALSIQAHPDSTLARKLHLVNPSLYPDPNEKPELAIAVTQLSLISGFRSRERIMQDFSRIPEILSFLDDSAQQDLLIENLSDREFNACLFSNLLASSKELIMSACFSLICAIKNLPERTPVDNWVLRMAEKYPHGDPGLFCFYFMNYTTIPPGEALFIPTNTPHAYLDGDLVECLANSDNVVRVALTAKQKDIKTFLSMVNYEPSKPLVIKAEKVPKSPLWRRFKTPATEFCVELLQGAREFVECDTNGACHLLFCLDVHGRLLSEAEEIELYPGSAIMLPAALGKYEISLDSGTLFKITCNT